VQTKRQFNQLDDATALSPASSSAMASGVMICQTAAEQFTGEAAGLKNKHLRIAIFCRNRPGLVQSITDKLSRLGANLGPTSFAVLGKGAEFTCVATVGGDREIWEFDSAILVMPELVDAQISVHEYGFGTEFGEENRVNFLLTIAGVDCPGLLADFTAFLGSLDVAVVRMTTEVTSSPVDPIFTTRFTVWIDPEHAAETLTKIDAHAQAHKLGVTQMIL